MPVANRNFVVAPATAPSATHGSSSSVPGSTIGPAMCSCPPVPAVGCSDE